MKRFVKLLNFEISRFILIYSVMMGVVVACQLVAARLNAKYYVDRVFNTMKDMNLSIEEFAQQDELYNMSYLVSSLSFTGPILFCIAVLVIYVFFIWYRDWFGKATISYRLMMLPTNRINVFFAKLLTLLLFIFAALAIEIAVMYSLMAWMPKIIPAELYEPIDVAMAFDNDVLFLILPFTVERFIFSYLLGSSIVMIVFTMIIFERSFRWKGILLGIVFAIINVIIICIPAIYQTITSRLFMNEIYILTFVIAVISCVVSLLTSNYLLKNKINV